MVLAAPAAHAQSADTTPPATPGGLSASLSNYDQISVSWGASTDNVGVLGYYLYRNGTLVANTSSTGFTDSVPPGGVYSYTVSAYDAAGNVSPLSIQSSPISVVLDTTPPSVPTWISLIPTTSSVALSWNPSSDNVLVIGYYLYRDGNKIPGIANPFTATTFNDTGLFSGYNYTYKIGAYDAAGNVSYSPTMNVMTFVNTPAPSIPGGLFVTPKSSTEIDIKWNVPQNGIVAGYYVYRNGSQIASVASATTAYADTGLPTNTTYLYTVAAYNSAGNVSGQSFSVQGTTFPPDTTPPSTPVDLAAAPVSTSAIHLSWLPSSDNVGVAGYYIYRDESEIASTASTTFTDTGLGAGTSHTYSVSAYDAAGNVSAEATIYSVWTYTTNSVVATTTPPPVVTPPPAAVPPPVTPPSTPPTATSPSGASFTTTLSYGVSNGQVAALQNFLVAKGYLSAGHATGFFGSLTQAAVQQFQCDEHVVCSGSAGTSGWGMVGAKTRAALNAVSGATSSGTGSASASSSVSSGSSPSITQLQAELQVLEAELSSLHAGQ